MSAFWRLFSFTEKSTFKCFLKGGNYVQLIKYMSDKIVQTLHTNAGCNVFKLYAFWANAGKNTKIKYTPPENKTHQNNLRFSSKKKSSQIRN